MKNKDLIKELIKAGPECEVIGITSELNCSCIDKSAGYCYCQYEDTEKYIETISFEKDKKTGEIIKTVIRLGN